MKKKDKELKELKQRVVSRLENRDFATCPKCNSKRIGFKQTAYHDVDEYGYSSRIYSYGDDIKYYCVDCDYEGDFDDFNFKEK